jgi:hypothetical protein
LREEEDEEAADRSESLYGFCLAAKETLEEKYMVGLHGFV